MSLSCWIFLNVVHLSGSTVHCFFFFFNYFNLSTLFPPTQTYIQKLLVSPQYCKCQVFKILVLWSTYPLKDLH